MLARTPAGLGFSKMIYVFSKRRKCFTPPPACRFSGCFTPSTLGSWYFSTASCACIAHPSSLLSMLDFSQGHSTSPAWVEIGPMSYFWFLSLPSTHTGAQHPFADSPTRYFWGEKKKGGGAILARQGVISQLSSIYAVISQCHKCSWCNQDTDWQNRSNLLCSCL